MSAYQFADLFRPEVAAARRQRLEGEIILARPVRAGILTALLVAIVVALAAWATLGTYTRSEVARGLLVTDRPAVKIVAARPGQVAALHVVDGQRVRAGQRLATIRVEQPSDDGSSLAGASLAALDRQDRLADRQVAQVHARASAEQARLAARIHGLHRQQEELAAQAELQKEVVASAAETFTRIGQVVERGFVSRIEFERRRQALLAARQQLAQLRQQSSLLAAEEAQAAAEFARVRSESASAATAVEAELAGLAQQRAQLVAARAYVLTSAISGRVTALQAAAGRTVDGAQPLMTVLPDKAGLTAQLYAPSRAIGFIRAGQEVRLLYDAFPYQRFGSFAGRVTSVSRTVLDPRDIAAPIKLEEPAYRIEVALEKQSVAAFGEVLPLQPGMTLSANLILDRRSFLDWLLQPLRAVLRKTS